MGKQDLSKHTVPITLMHKKTHNAEVNTNEAHVLTHTQPQLLLRVLATLQFHQTKWESCVFPVSAAAFQKLCVDFFST